MDTQQLLPPIDVLEDFRTLQTTLHDDESGQQTRAMVRYLEDAATRSLQMKLQAAGSEEREFAALLHEAFQAAQRITLAAWERSHNTPLTH